MLKKACFVLFLLIATGIYGFAGDIGTYRIPAAVTYGGTPVAAGNYLIQIVDGAEGPYLQLSQGGNVVAKDLAIVIPAKGPGNTAVQVAPIAGQDFWRIRVRSGDNFYYAYLQKTH